MSFGFLQSMPRVLVRWRALSLLAALCALASPESSAQVTALPTSFARCPDFFLGKRPPEVASRPGYRELCYDGFAVLHSGDTRTTFATDAPGAAHTATL